MNFKVDFNDSPSFIRMALVSSELFLLALFVIAILHFIEWDFPSNTYFRGLAVNIACVLLFAHLNKDQR